MDLLPKSIQDAVDGDPALVPQPSEVIAVPELHKESCDLCVYNSEEMYGGFHCQRRRFDDLCGRDVCGRDRTIYVLNTEEEMARYRYTVVTVRMRIEEVGASNATSA